MEAPPSINFIINIKNLKLNEEKLDKAYLRLFADLKQNAAIRSVQRMPLQNSLIVDKSLQSKGGGSFIMGLLTAEVTAENIGAALFIFLKDATAGLSKVLTIALRYSNDDAMASLTLKSFFNDSPLTPRALNYSLLPNATSSTLHGNFRRAYIGSSKQPTITICNLVNGVYETQLFREGEQLVSAKLSGFQLPTSKIFNRF